MLPVSEADPEIKARVEQVLGPCRCTHRYRAAWVGHAEDKRDPDCDYHVLGEDVADMAREIRRLKQALARVSHYNQLRKVQS